MTFYPRFAESLGTTGFKGRGYLVVDYFLAGKSAHDRRQRDARMHGANVHSIDIGQIADDGDAIDRHWPESDTSQLRFNGSHPMQFILDGPGSS
ncbi:hypothetical protein D3C73_1140380 [compost metagenome]